MPNKRKRHPDGLWSDGPALSSVELPFGWRLEGLVQAVRSDQSIDAPSVITCKNSLKGIQDDFCFSAMGPASIMP